MVFCDQVALVLLIECPVRLSYQPAISLAAAVILAAAQIWGGNLDALNPRAESVDRNDSGTAAGVTARFRTFHQQQHVQQQLRHQTLASIMATATCRAPTKTDVLRCGDELSLLATTVLDEVLGEDAVEFLSSS